MPKVKISEYSTTNSANTDIESINIDEGCAPSGINNAIRELMVHLKEFQTGSSGDPLTVAGGMFISGGGSANTLTVTGILTASGGTILSSTNTLSGSNIISGNINSSGTTNTFSGGNILSGTNTISGSAIISGNINSSGTNTFSGSNVMSFGAGTSASPSIYFASDTNTGIFSPAADTIAFTEGGVEAMRIDSSGRVGIGTTSPAVRMHVQGSAGQLMRVTDGTTGASIYSGSALFGFNNETGEDGMFGSTASHFLYFATNGSERARITSGGNLLVGTTNAYSDGRLVSYSASGVNAVFVTDDSTVNAIITCRGDQASGNQIFVRFATDSNAERGSITYNRAGGLVAYNTTSDYRAKDISGPITDSGALIDSVPVYMGKMKGATQERPMFIAHEVPAYAHTGVKDAVDKDGKPVYQQMDASALIPVMWAEIQDLRKRLAAAGI